LKAYIKCEKDTKDNYLKKIEPRRVRMTKVRGKAKNALHEGKVFLNTHRLPLAFL